VHYGTATEIRVHRQTVLRSDSPVTVMMVDLDQFKLVNDTWGHDAGDQLLVSVGQRLATAARAEDTIARFGGDGFIVVCEDTDEDHARQVAEHLMAALTEPFDLDGQRLHVRASIGIAVCPPHAAPDLVRFAEAAMYDAKARGRWALNRACRDAAVLRATLPRLHVAVNISVAHLDDPDLEQAVLSTLDAGGLSAAELMLEITESAMMANVDHARELLTRLKAHGVESAIDDFGTGYSSLSYLGRLPASTIKIDCRFVEHITTDADAMTITSAVIRLANRLRLTTIADGRRNYRAVGRPAPARLQHGAGLPVQPGGRASRLPTPLQLPSTPHRAQRLAPGRTLPRGQQPHGAQQLVHT
jgi:diguanylate cyclase (GGDEF)-like protein